MRFKTHFRQYWQYIPKDVKVGATGLLIAFIAALPYMTVQAHGDSTHIHAETVQASQSSTTSVRDCDTNAIMYCGAYSKDEWVRKIIQGDGKHSVENLQAIYGMFGIDGNGIESAHTVDGEVHADGRVTVNGATIATSALSSGRQFMEGSSKKGDIYTRPTSVSFRSGSIPAFVHMENGVFKWAVIKSCGNPVTAIPVEQPKPPQEKHPRFSLEKKADDTSVKAGATITYTIKIKNTGDITLTDLRHVDELSEGLAYVNGSTKINGSGVPDGITGTGITLPTLDVDSTATITYQVTTDVRHKECNTARLANRIVVTPKETASKSDSTTVIVDYGECIKPTKATYQCDYLETIKVDKNTYKFVAHASTSGNAQITRYAFSSSDEHEATIETDTDTAELEMHFADSGTHTARVRVYFDVNGSEKSDSGNDCTQQITIDEPHNHDHKEPHVHPAIHTEIKAPAKTLPNTGPSEILMSFFGLGFTTLSTRTWLHSRKILAKAALKR